MKEQDRYLDGRKGNWHYVRRVPKQAKHLDPRKVIERSLKTRSIEIARIRRDELEAADNEYWQALSVGGGNNVEVINQRHKTAVARAKVLGFVYRTVDELTNIAPISEVISRALTLDRGRGVKGDLQARDIEALLGGAPKALLNVGACYDLYKNEIAAVELKSKSPAQLKKWDETKSRSVNNFISVVGDKRIGEITREDGLSFFSYFQNRILGKGEDAPISIASANRNIGDVRKMIGDYFSHIGEPDYKNPLDGLFFKKIKGKPRKTRQPYELDFLSNQVVPALATGDLNREAKHILLTLVETGARPSEIFNLTKNRIFLDVEVPFIRVEFDDEMEIKTETSIRDIPLVGVSLMAMRAYPKGFPRYRDKSSGFSNCVNRFLSRAGLRPTSDHSAYSIRHSFEKRMIEGGLDSDLRRLLMGHKIDRPKYGDGGSMTFRRDELLKITLDVSDDVQRALAG